MMKKIFAVMIGVILAGPALAQGPPPATVVTAKVVAEEVAATQAVTGILYYDRISDLSTEVAGLVDDVMIRQGDRVKKNDPLVKLDTELLEQEILLTKTRIEQAELRITNSEKNFKRLDRLFRESGVSEKDFDDALFNYEDAKKEKKALQNSLATLMIKKKRSLIRAPFDGIVLTKDVDSGAWVQQGKQLLSLGSVEDLMVRVPVAETLLPYLTASQEVEVVINAFNKRVIGTIDGIDPVADMKTKNIFTKIRIPSMDLVAANMSVAVHVPAAARKKLSLFQRAGLVKFKGKDFVYTIKEGKAAILPVHVVAFLGDKVAVDTPYIVPGMAVVVEGNERLRPDQPVKVMEER